MKTIVIKPIIISIYCFFYGISLMICTVLAERHVISNCAKWMRSWKNAIHWINNHISVIESKIERNVDVNDFISALYIFITELPSRYGKEREREQNERMRGKKRDRKKKNWVRRGWISMKYWISNLLYVTFKIIRCQYYRYVLSIRCSSFW